MSETTNIEWCDSTFNPWIGCTRVSPACDDCYAARSTPARTLGVAWGPGEARRRTSASNWAKPLQWNAQQFVQCASCAWRGDLRDFKGASGWTMCPACSGADWHGARRRVFCASLADVFDKEVEPAWRADLFALIDKTPNLDWLLLTKRIGNVSAMLDEVSIALALRETGAPWPPRPNVWLGATVVNQAEADRDIPKLLAVQAAVRFLSIEPMLGPINIQAAINRMPWQICGGDAGLHWVICGGESGPNARPMHPDWARSLRDQCAAADVPFLFKQWGEHTAGELAPHPGYPDDKGAWRIDGRGKRWHDVMEGLRPRETWAPVRFLKVGKKAAGRLLDGRTHDGFPEPRA